MAKKRPNVLIMFADQLRADALGCHGNTCCRTPNVDKMAREGVVFDRCYSPNPICVPARAVIITGNYAHLCTGDKSMGGKIGDDQVKLPALFAQNGYETYSCGKLHYSPYAPPGQPRLLHGWQHCDLAESGRIIAQYDPKGTLRGLEDYHDYLVDVGWPGYDRAHGIGNNDVRPCPSPLPPEHHVDHWIADRTIQRMREHRKGHPDKPFMIWCGFTKPHSPYDPPYEYVKMYDPRKVPPPVGDESLLLDRCPHPERERYQRAMTTLSPAARQVIKAYYYALITHQDAQIGRIFAAMKELGVEDDTLVIYTADHGDLMGDFGSYFKAVFYEGSAHIPFLWKGPGIPKNQRRQQLGSLQDVLPTLAAMCGVPMPKAVQGADLTGVLNDPKAPLRELYYGQCLKPPRQMAMVTDGRWKLCYAQEGGVEELYDLQADPHELVNLVSKPGNEKLVASWREKLIAEATRLGDTAMIVDGKLAKSPLDREALKALPIKDMGWRWF